MNLTPLLEDYIEKNSSEEPSLLKELRRETFLKTTQPHMLSGLLQGRLLNMISKLMAPRLIVEIGTFTGYATLCLAEGLSESGKIITVDSNCETAYIPKKYFQKSEFSRKINFILDDAINVIQEIDQEIDIVFLDADKKNYCKYVEILKPKLRSGGIIIADNILWKGKVVGDFKDKKTESIRDFNSSIRSDSSLEVIILPIRDGISIIRKK
jgi:caffeoyl-CoA O-methyltransferase